MMVNVIMELIDRFIEFILQRLPDDATETEKHCYVMRMMVITFSVLFWGLIAITVANIDLKRDNYTLNKTVGKVNTLLDVNNPTNPLNALLLLNNETLVKLHGVNEENTLLVKETWYLQTKLSVCANRLVQLEGEVVQEDTPPTTENFPKKPTEAIITRPINGIKEDEKLIDEAVNPPTLQNQ